MHRRHLLDIHDLTAAEISKLLDQAAGFYDTHGNILSNATLDGRTVATLFFEPSTRTRCSFDLAAQKLGANVIHLDVARSSTQKGESLQDTFLTLQAMQCDAMIVRHAQAGTAAYLSTLANQRCAVINAGDGANAHPSQALLDLLTLRQSVGPLADLKIAIVGDIRHSRVARSQVLGLERMGVRDIRLVAPLELMPAPDWVGATTTRFNNLTEGLAGVDAILALRLQHERMLDLQISPAQYFADYGLTEARIAQVAPLAKVLHPGPINREVEISSEVADGPRSLILQQVTHGVAMRMAILQFCLQ